MQGKKAMVETWAPLRPFPNGLEERPAETVNTLIVHACVCACVYMCKHTHVGMCEHMHAHVYMHGCIV